jgi:hypothetical protein
MVQRCLYWQVKIPRGTAECACLEKAMVILNFVQVELTAELFGARTSHGEAPFFGRLEIVIGVCLLEVASSSNRHGRSIRNLIVSLILDD